MAIRDLTVYKRVSVADGFSEEAINLGSLSVVDGAEGS